MSDPSVTNESKIKVMWTAPSDNGGAPIESYGVEIDDGAGGDFHVLVGDVKDYLTFEYTVSEGITRATNYRFRYRSRNHIGWSDYSDIVYILSAKRPEKPPRPAMVETDSTSITLALQQTTDDGGSPVIGYQLSVDAGDDFNSGFT